VAAWPAAVQVKNQAIAVKNEKIILPTTVSFLGPIAAPLT
jgi:hypothetical protein